MSIVIIFLSVSNFYLRIKLLKLKKEILKHKTEKKYIQGKLDSLANGELNGFNKFISESRDWAFSYIESAQKSIKDFIVKTGPDIEYLKEYKPPIISEDAIDRLVLSYEDLKKLLPLDEK
jgi:hypothetical protein